MRKKEHRKRSGSAKENYSSTIKNELLYKTEKCRNQWNGKGVCKYSSKCRYAHSSGELRNRVRGVLYKTIECVNWKKYGNCSYGHRCHYKHTEKIMAQIMAGPHKPRKLKNEVISPPINDTTDKSVNKFSLEMAAEMIKAQLAQQQKLPLSKSRLVTQWKVPAVK